jgi:hypothetical protein
MSSFEDHIAVTDVVNRYAHALDDRQWPLLDEVFSAEAVARYGRPDSPALKGRKAIVAMIRAALDGCGPSQHLLGNHTVDVRGETATATCKGRIYHVGAGERSALIPYECFGVYHDNLRRGPDGWRIVDRLFHIHLEAGDRNILQPA